MIRHTFALLALISTALASSGAAVKSDFTIRCQVDFSNVAAYEPLYEVGPVRAGFTPVRLAFRIAGRTKGLEQYDNRLGNYLNFPLPDGSCPVIEATLCARGGRVGIPLGALARTDGVHEVTLNYSPPHWTICVDGVQDDDMPPAPDAVAGLLDPKERTLSPRVKKAEFTSPARPDALPQMPDSRRITRSIQYWTPDDPNAWVGDVAPGLWRGRLHVFYLFDRRHHGSGGGTGRHYFAHLSTADLVKWDEHPHAVPIEEWWETLGTGTPFVKDGKLHLAYGLHTSRLTKDPAYPIGGTYAESEDGIHFSKSGKIITGAQNPSIYNNPGGGFELVTSYGGQKGIFRSDDLVNWKLYDDKLPFRGDCPSLFDWHGHRYLLQGFTKMAYSPDGSPGSFIDWTNEPDIAYEGLSVPMIVPWKGDRRLYIGWMRHLAGWGGWLVFRELVFYPDGHLGLKWVPEIQPPVPPVIYRAQAGERLVRKFVAEGNRPALVLTVDPMRREASFADDVPAPKFALPHQAENFKVGGLRCVAGAYEVKLVVWYDSKADATIFDAEIGGERTMICRRPGKFKAAGGK